MIRVVPPPHKEPSDTAAHAGRFIRVRGAAEHNLKSLDVDIPRDKLVVMTGVSGSGKSSLAFDTIFAEGQRKYMESLSAYARQFLDQLQKPHIESIEGLPPTIAIEQRSGGHNPRSTVATTTEIYDYLRLLFARCGTPTCWDRDEIGETSKRPNVQKKGPKAAGGEMASDSASGALDVLTGGAGRLDVSRPPHVCGQPITASSATQIVDTLMDWPGDGGSTRVMVCSPVVRGKKGFHREVIESLQKHGFVRARVNGTIIDIREALKEGGDNPLNLGRYELHTIEAVVDRVVISSDAALRQRLADSVEVALRLSEGLLVVLREEKEGIEASRHQGIQGKDASAPSLDASVGGGGGGGGWVEHRFSEKFACPDHPECSLDELEPRLFSFNSPYGACPRCDGLGTINEFDEALVVPDETEALCEAIEPWRKNGRRMNIFYGRAIRAFADKMGISKDSPICKLNKTARRVLMHGTTDADEAKFGFSFEGVIPNLHRRYDNSESAFVKERLQQYMSGTPCPACEGRRLRIEALHVMLKAKPRDGNPWALKGNAFNIADVTSMTIENAQAFFASIDLNKEQKKIAEPILREINARLGFLSSVGLNYLTLDRTAATLSGGEAQRIRLATLVGSGLVGVCYVLDEPTIGLHQRDNDRLISTLRRLSDIGNTVLVVEHDDGMIRAADHVIDIGPDAGKGGGRVIAEGTVDDIIDAQESKTGAYLSGRMFVPVPAPSKRRAVGESKAITVKGARANNLKSIDVAFPLGGMICVTGVSGSGKSTLVNEVLLKSARKQIAGSREQPGAHSRVTGLNRIERVVEVDQSPIGRTPRSNPATYTGIFDQIRMLFASTKESKIRGYDPGRFSFNVKGGRCEACQGQGVKRIEMHFLPDVFVTCETCKGKRYNRETLEITYRHKTISDVLDMTIEDAVRFFDAHPKVLRMLQCLHDVGLDYVQLGQPSTTLSGGEAQRIKLASELGTTVGNMTSPHTLYVLDEPTTGLHFADVHRLIGVLDRLADAGHTLVVIEHNLDVIKCADWVIDLGPEGGDRGGAVVATGTPEDITRVKASFTGRYLKPVLAARPTTSRRQAVLQVD